MIDNILYYVIGSLCVSNVICVWKLTNISVHLYKFLFFFKKNDLIFTVEDLEDHLAMNWGKIGELLICPLCLATHVSWITGLIIYLISDCTPYIVLYGSFSWPLISFLFYGIAKKIN